VAILLELAERQPVLLIIEDLHWTDPSTLELLNLLIEQTPTASLFTTWKVIREIWGAQKVLFFEINRLWKRP
jgi:predicted ATPase